MNEVSRCRLIDWRRAKFDSRWALEPDVAIHDNFSYPSSENFISSRRQGKE